MKESSFYLNNDNELIYAILCRYLFSYLCRKCSGYSILCSQYVKGLMYLLASCSLGKTIALKYNLHNLQSA